ncbi:MAG: flagellar motor switch protein FliG [Rhodobacteraceae bacterium]|nr:flagellar motor switch protein FliG [Paracoccaceae bacterium]
MQNDVGSQLPMAMDFGSSPLGSPSDQPSFSGGSGKANSLNSVSKAAIVVRLLLKEGADIPLEQLPEELQAKLAQQMSRMGLVDRDTLEDVVQEFASQVDGVGLHFPHGLHAAIESLDGRISVKTADKLRKAAGMPKSGDPWPALRERSEDELAEVMKGESIEVAAVLLSKLDTEKAAALLGQLPGPMARKITHAVSLTRNVTPDAVLRIGQSLAEQFDDQPDLAFDVGPDERLGAILNRTSASVRDEVLGALNDIDQPFCTQVKRHIFTFEHIPDRIDPMDVPKIIRAADQMTLVTALAGAEAAGYGEVAEFIYRNLSTRMSDNLKEETGEIGTVRAEDVEAAMQQVITAINGEVEKGEIKLIPLDGPDVQIE